MSILSQAGWSDLAKSCLKIVGCLVKKSNVVVQRFLPPSLIIYALVRAHEVKVNRIPMIQEPGVTRAVRFHRPRSCASKDSQIVSFGPFATVV